MATVRSLLLSLAVAALLYESAAAATVAPRSLPAQSGATQRLLADAQDGKLDEHSLIRAALVAGGIDDATELNRLEDRVNQLAAELGSSVLFDGDEGKKARVLHEFLHTHLLHLYDAGATDLRAALDHGTYNCVTGTVLYVAIGRKCGLDLIAEQSRGHVRCVMRGPEGLILETTQARWTMPEASPGRRLRQTELLAVFFFNRAHGLHAEQRFEEAVAALVVARALDPQCPEVQGNLLATINNWALSREAAGDPVGAEQVRAKARQLTAEH